MSTLMILGLILIFLGLILVMLPEHSKTSRGEDLPEWRRSKEREEREEAAQKSDIRGGGIIMIGPIPIVFGSDPKAAIVMMMIALAIMLTMLAWAIYSKSL